MNTPTSGFNLGSRAPCADTVGGDGVTVPGRLHQSQAACQVRGWLHPRGRSELTRLRLGWAQFLRLLERRRGHISPKSNTGVARLGFQLADQVDPVGRLSYVSGLLI